MPLSNSIATYNDVKVVLDTAVDRGGGRYRLPTVGAARHWVQRAYKYRQLRLQLSAESLGVPGIAPSTPYDQLILRLDGVDVVIGMREPEGQFFDLEGEVVELQMEDEAEELINKYLEVEDE